MRIVEHKSNEWGGGGSHVEISTRKYSTVAGKNLRSKTRSICNHVPSTFCIIQYEYIAVPSLFCTTHALVAHICFLGSESCPIAMQKKMCHFLHMSNQCTGTSLHACTVSDAGMSTLISRPELCTWRQGGRMDSIERIGTLGLRTARTGKVPGDLPQICSWAGGTEEEYLPRNTSLLALIH